MDYARLRPSGCGGGGLTLALGGVGLDLETLARAYVAFANAGQVPSQLVFMPGRKIKWRAFIDTEAAQAVRHILGSAPPPGGRSGLSTSLRSVAYKTGTSCGYRDAMAVGIVGDYVIGVWVVVPMAFIALGALASSRRRLQTFSILPPCCHKLGRDCQHGQVRRFHRI
jgi:penicillin-binding protein 1C